MLILIIAIPRAATKFDDVGIFESATEVFGVFLDNGFALNRLLRYKCSAFRKTNLGSIPFGFSNALLKQLYLSMPSSLE